MFSENLKTIRKAKGYTQEELAIKINVFRQTVSKWKKGLSVPNAEMLSRLLYACSKNNCLALAYPMRLTLKQTFFMTVRGGGSTHG